MRVLTVPNWSFGRDTDLLRRFDSILSERAVDVHYLASDVDHNRTVSAFSGSTDAVEGCLIAMCGEAFDRVDLNRHVGVHPRIGALDVCPFVHPWRDDDNDLHAWVESIGGAIAEKFEVPVFLYELSERGRHAADLPTLRKGGFGSLLDRKIEPDFGPNVAHERLGATVLGLRPFLIAINVNLKAEDGRVAKQIAKEIRDGRKAGDERFAGVRALGLAIPSREMSQVSLNLTQPDRTHLDSLVQTISVSAQALGTEVIGTELIGVIRDVDMEHTTIVDVRPEQVIATR
ncbi:MAG: hypothetical protein IH944_08820 [Armatimonadetes bacterium]|nr:hypothetical protein [Armatimonadota bacterium]